MIFYLSCCDDDEIRVEVRENEGGYHVTFPDDSLAVRIESGPGHIFSLIDQEGKQFEMILRDEGEGKVRVGWGSEEIMIDVLTELESRVRKAVKATKGASGWEMNASLPGKIKKILVKTGKHVSAGDPLLIMEAMKMENEIRADQEGIIRAVHRKEGEAVEAGAVLVSADPPGSKS